MNQMARHSDVSDSPPLVTVGVPVYNGARYLRDALESLRHQTLTDFEVIVCDNASTDATSEIAGEYVRNDPRFQSFRSSENLGLVRNYRRALQLARGRYFKWLSSDDTVSPDYLAAMISALEADPEAVLCACQMLPIGNDGEAIPFDEDADAHIAASGERYRVWPAPAGLSDERAHVRFNSTVNMLPGNMQGQFYYGVMRTAVVSQLPPHGLYLGAERVFQAELALQGRWLYIDRPLAQRRIHIEHFGRGSGHQVAVGLDPQSSRRISFSAAQQFAGYVRAIHSVPLQSAHRLYAYRSIIRKVLTAGIWKSPWQRRYTTNSGGAPSVSTITQRG